MPELQLEGRRERAQAASGIRVRTFLAPIVVIAAVSKKMKGKGF
jgi:hypothetical protein